MTVRPAALAAFVPRTPALLAGAAAALVFVIWAVTGLGYFWPGWVWTALALLLGLATAWRWAHAAPPSPRRRLEAQGAVSVVLAVYLLFVWALAGGGYFWPIWPAIGLALALGLRLIYMQARGYDLSPARERELSERVDVLTRTRRGALDVQAAELRRIERDLHDGAQARLVALSMQLGRAEAGLSDRPEAAELVRAAREEATAAVAELRDLSRGIAPPILVDRGLVAAVQSLGERSAIPVAVAAEVERRPPPAVETAAYFVVAEAVTNVAKHAPESEARVAIVLDAEALAIEVADDGPGGADPGGGGLSGLRQRVEALDGTMSVASREGGGTRLRVVIPCGS